MTESKMLSPVQVAEVRGLDVGTVYGYLRSGKIKLVYYKELAGGSKYYTWAYTEDNGAHFGIVQKVFGDEHRVFLSRGDLETILKNEEVPGPVSAGEARSGQ